MYSLFNRKILRNKSRSIAILIEGKASVLDQTYKPNIPLNSRKHNYEQLFTVKNMVAIKSYDNGELNCAKSAIFICLSNDPARTNYQMYEALVMI